MVRRSVLIATIQLALATSAVAGVASVFMQRGSMAGRTAWTALIVLVASVCLLPLSRPSSDGRISALEVLWGGFIGVGAALTLGLVWNVLPPGPPRDLLLTATLSWVGFGTPTAMILLPALRRRTTPSALSYPASSGVAVLGAGACFLLAVGAMVAMEQAGSNRTEFVPFGFIISILSVVLASANLVSFSLPRLMDRAARIDRIAGTLGVLATLGGWGTWMSVAALSTNLLEVASAGSQPAREALMQRFLTPAVACTGLAISGALWCALRAVRFRGWSVVLPPTTAAVTLALTSLLTVASIHNGLPDFATRITIALAIIDASALVTVVLVLRARRSSPDTEDFVQPIEGLPMKCPRCSAPRVATLGESACGSCGLVLLLAVRDDVCPACKYDLRGQMHGPCPECGRLRQMPGLVSATVPTN